MKTLLTLFTFIFLLSSCDKKEESQSALGTGYTGSCIIGKWTDASLPLTLRMSSEFSNDYSNVNLVNGLNPIEQMAKVWNDAVATKTLLTTPFPIASNTGYGNTTNFRDSEIGIYKSHTWFSNVSSNALAITQFYGNVMNSQGLGQYIQLSHADIIVNYRDYGARLTMTNNPTIEFDLPTIILHEMGHLLGLCHESVKPSIMAPYYLTTQHNVRAYDIDLIKDVYIDGVISGYSVQNNNTNALSSPIGTEVKGIIELHADGKCLHYVNGKKIYEHVVDAFKRK